MKSLIHNFFNKNFIVGSTLALSLAGATLTACSGEDGVDGKDAAEVNVDSLANVLRDEITGTLWDTLYAEPYVDTVYNILFNNAFAEAWMDSVRNALLDSLKLADYDSLYAKLYDSVYADIYSQSVIRTLDAWTWSAKEDIYGAFANLYPLMYKDYTSEGEPTPQPISIKVRNACEKGYTEEDLSFMSQEDINKMIVRTPQCRWKKIMVKSWIEGFTDTAVTTGNVNPDTTALFAPSFKFDNEALLALTAPTKASIQVRAYALENDHEIPFFATSEPTTIHPMQVNGAELAGVKNRVWYDGVWVTPNMDSIPAILEEMAELLPDKVLKVYQKYEGDESISESSARVVQALFKVLQKRKLRYIENDGAGSMGQKVNYPVEVLRTKQGVCNELSFLVASILEAAGFDVYLVVLPSHMFVGWAGEVGTNSLGFLETTMLAQEDATFGGAYLSGGEKFNQQVEAGNFENGTSQIMEMAALRTYGITPNDIP